MLVSALTLLVAWASAAAIGSATEADAVCSYLFDKYPAYTAWDPLNPNALESIKNATLWVNNNLGYWDRRNLGNRATCTFFPESATQVAEAVKQLNQHPSVPFALKSGGHNFNKGFSSVNKGLLISFNENLASTVRSADGNSFVVGTGARWGSVYEVTQKTNQVVVGGRLSNIGVGGFTLGGGLSYYSAQYGLACDNVIDFEVVLPDGTVTHANAQQNSDLWWALRGGGNRYAIVTKFTLKAHPLGVNGRIWGGTRTYAATSRGALFDALAKFVRDYPDAKAAVIPTFEFALPLGLVQLPLIFLFYDGPDPGTVFAAFDAIPHLTSSTQTKPYTEMANETGGAALRGFGTAAHVSTFPNLPPQQMAQFYEKHWDLYGKRAINNTVRGLDIQVLSWAAQPLSARIAQASQDQGGNSIGLKPEHGDRIWIENSMLWLNPACDGVCPGYMKDVAEEVERYQRDTFPGVPPTNHREGDVGVVSYNPLFMNDAANYQDVYSSYGAENEAQLRSAQQKYDPSGLMFRQSGWIFQ